MLPLGVSAVTVGFGFLIALDSPPLDLRTSPAIIPIAHALIAIPFVVRVMLPVLQSIDPRLREAAAMLGAAPRRVWLEVDLRIAARAALVAAGFAFAISLGEFGATLFIVRPETTTLPGRDLPPARPARGGELRPGDGREHDPHGAHRGVGARDRAAPRPRRRRVLMLEIERLRVRVRRHASRSTASTSTGRRPRGGVRARPERQRQEHAAPRDRRASSRPTAGRVAWDGDDLTPVPPHRRQFGLMFQDHALFPHRDVLGNVAFGLRMQRHVRARRSTRGARAALARVGLAGFEHRRVRELSGGEQQRVALARALAPDPRLLMLDEPLGSLDRELRERLAAELRALFVALGVTALFVTHDQDEAFALADRVVIMRAGHDRAGRDARRRSGAARRPSSRPGSSASPTSSTRPSTRDGVHCAVGAAPDRRPRRRPRRRRRSRSRLAARPDALRLDPATARCAGRVTATTFRRDHFLVQVDTELGPLEVAADDAARSRHATVGLARRSRALWWSSPHSLALR